MWQILCHIINSKSYQSRGHGLPKIGELESNNEILLKSIEYVSYIKIFWKFDASGDVGEGGLYMVLCAVKAKMILYGLNK